MHKAMHRPIGRTRLWFPFRSSFELRAVNVFRTALRIVIIASVTGCSTLVESQPPPPMPRFTIDLLKGRGTQVCEAYTDWLRRGQPADRVFDVDLGERLVGYEPEWLLLGNVEAYLWARDVNPTRYVTLDQLPQWKRTPEQLSEARDGFHRMFASDIEFLGYRVARVDIDNDGVADNVFFTVRQSGSTLLVLNDEKTEVDRTRTERLLAHMRRAAAGWPDVIAPWPDERSQYALRPVMDAYSGAYYIVFSYMGSVYVRFWWDSHPEHSTSEWIEIGTQHIFRVDKLDRTEVCEYRVVL
jgi:hypothetical protein